MSGLCDVLTPQANLNQVEREQVEDELAVTTDVLTLYKALRGGAQVSDGTQLCQGKPS